MAGLGLDSIYEDEDAAEQKPAVKKSTEQTAPSGNAGAAVPPPSSTPSATVTSGARLPTVEQAAKEGGQVVKKAFEYLNPIHLKEGVKEFKTYEDVDPYATGAHGLADLMALQATRKILGGIGEGVSSGIAGRISNAIKGVDPTIAAQNAQNDKGLMLKYGSQQGKLNPIATPIGRIEPTLNPQPLAPQAGQTSTAPAIPPESVAQTEITKTTKTAPYKANTLGAGAEANVEHNKGQILGNKALQAEGGGYSRAPGSVILTPDQLINPPNVKTKAAVPPVLSEAEQFYNVTAKTPAERQMLEDSYRNKMSKQGGFVNPSVMGEAMTNMGKAIAPPMAQFARNVGANIVGAAPMIPLAMATDIQGQNRGYRRELEQELNKNNDPARRQMLLDELSKLDNEKYLKGIQGRLINKTVPPIYR